MKVGSQSASLMSGTERGQSGKRGTYSGSGTVAIAAVDATRDKVAEKLLVASSSTDGVLSTAAVCFSDEIAISQQEEIAVLSEIFPPVDWKIIRSAPMKAGDATGQVRIRIITDDALDLMKQGLRHRKQTSVNSQNFNLNSFMTCGGEAIFSKWHSELYMTFEMSQKYPEDVQFSSNVDIEVGTLSLLEFNIAMKEQLLDTMVSCGDV